MSQAVTHIEWKHKRRLHHPANGLWQPSREGVPTKTPLSRPATRSRVQKVPIHLATLEQLWPPLHSEILAWKELEQDEWYPQLSSLQISTLVTEAIRFGQKAAQSLRYKGTLEPWINRIIRSNVKIQLLRRRTDDSDSWVRAQYRHKPPVIEIHHSSLDQLDQFFRRSGFQISQDDLIALHLLHEWFHHLESTQLGRTDDALPKAVKKKWGPFYRKSRITRLREIAAHAFTQEVMGLPWSPLWLDHLLLLTGKGWGPDRIRTTFHHWKTGWEELTSTAKASQDEDETPS
ncbi:hypothetical protein [Desmospora activa]|uniref:Uncharacterized protein n=1 Tax=Desmospora activa DSM 45169 TaxID=1121389 RepID=A0A2T4Z8I1_9BACL|nr:hypothetical protein [Desmospora activa]PTM58197.1 hypothetical protein C8J48_0775 [Desmospora activa DSM 45169]